MLDERPSARPHRGVALLSLFVALSVACSGLLACTTPPTEPAEPSESEGVEFVIEASAPSVAELGVREWRILRAPSKVTIRGDDDAGVTVAELVSVWQSRADAFRSRHRLTLAHDSATTTVSVERANGEGTVAVEHDPPRASDAVRRAYELLGADIEREPTTSSLVVAGSEASSLGVRPLDTPLTANCPSSLVCRQTTMACVKSPVNLVLDCYPGNSVRKVVFKVGKKLFDWARGKDERFDPVQDCVDSIKSLGSCDKLDEECDPVGIAACNELPREECERACAGTLDKTCNSIGPDNQVGTADDAPTCDAVRAEYDECLGTCAEHQGR